MTLTTLRLGGSEREPFTLEVQGQLPFASTVLWHLARMRGVRVVAKKSWALTDDFEAYFLYKSRLFVLETPFVNIWLSLVGQPADETLFAEVEAHLQRFSRWSDLLFPVAYAKYFFVRPNPPREILVHHDPEAPQ